MILAGDIGGTKTNLALYTCTRSTEKELTLVRDSLETRLNAEFETVEDLVCSYLAGMEARVDSAVFAVAGPVRGEQAKITNLPWVINTGQVAAATGIPAVHLMNDLEATAYAVPFLTEAEVLVLNSGRPVKRGNIGVIAPGTGLGESFLTWTGERSFRAHATEGSHVDFAPTDALQCQLLDYLLTSFEHVSYERICSGIGIPNIYSFLKKIRNMEEPEWLGKKFKEEKDLAAVIVNAALLEDQSCEICRMTMEIFLSVLGAEAGNFALKIMAGGGIYVGGGIIPRILPLLENGHFMQAFSAKGRMSGLLADMPVRIILNPRVAVSGAARYGMDAVGL